VKDVARNERCFKHLVFPHAHPPSRSLSSPRPFKWGKKNVREEEGAFSPQKRVSGWPQTRGGGGATRATTARRGRFPPSRRSPSLAPISSGALARVVQWGGDFTRRRSPPEMSRAFGSNLFLRSPLSKWRSSSGSAFVSLPSQLENLPPDMFPGRRRGEFPRTMATR